MSELSNNNVLSYPTMTRQRADKIQAKEIAYAEDVNAEFDHIVDVYNRLVSLLTGEWGDDTGRIYDLVDNAISLANEALAKANDCVQKSGDTMTGHLNIALVPTSDYNVVNKKYVDDTIDAELSDPINRISQLENFRDNLNASQVKLENANFSSTNVNDGMNELFISVSNGKKTVADAITGKGVATSGDASFKQMADNINAILTFNEGTAGGTATAGDIMYGKTAYARNTLIVGTYVPIDLSDATATSDKILEGYTAYVYGGKIIGTYIPPRDYPVYGTDTSNATATASDIAYGKTAYARGQYLVGTLRNTDVEEIYGINTNTINVKELIAMTRDPITGENITRNVIGFSKDNNYCVSSATMNGVKYIESYAINENGLYVQQSSNMGGQVTTKKYRYTYAELGIGDNEEIDDIEFTCAGVRNVAQDCYLILLTSENVDDDYYQRVRVYTYHLRDNGVIGKEYDTQQYIVENLNDIVQSGSSYRIFKLATPNLSSNYFYVVGTDNVNASSVGEGYINIFKYKIQEVASGAALIKTQYIGDKSKKYYETPGNVLFSDDDKYLYDQVSKGVSYLFCYISEDYIPEPIYNLTNCKSAIKIPGTDYVFCVTQRVVSVYKETYEESSSTPTYTKLKQVLVNQDTFSSTSPMDMVSALAMPDGNTLLVIAAVYTMNTYKDAKIITLNVSDIINAEADTEIEISSVIDLLASNSSAYYPLLATTDYTRIFSNYSSRIFEIKQELDNENIVGIKYKDQYFYSSKSKLLTAAATDVANGKTFIGNSGYPETGTMEV